VPNVTVRARAPRGNVPDPFKALGLAPEASRGSGALPSWATEGMSGDGPKPDAAPAEHDTLGNVAGAVPSGLYGGFASPFNLPNQAINAASTALRNFGLKDFGGQLPLPVNPNPTGYQPQGPIARTVESGAAAVGSLPSMAVGGEVAPLLSEGGTARAAATALGEGAGRAAVAPVAAGGLLGQAAEEAAPDWLKPYANLAGNVTGAGLVTLGGVPFRAGASMLGRQGVRVPNWLGGNYITPKVQLGDQSVTPSQAVAAGQRVLQAAGPDAAELQMRLNEPASPLPGYERTVAQQAPLPGVVDLDTAYRTAYGPQFNARMGQQATAQSENLQGLADPNASPFSVGRYFTGQLDALGRQGAAEAIGAEQGVREQVSAAGGTGTPEGYGAPISAAVEGVQAPRQAAAGQAVSEAETARNAALAATPAGRQPIAGGGTVAEQAGAEARGQTLAARSAEADRLDRLKNAINPEGDAGTYSAPFREGVEGVYAGRSDSAQPLSADETAIGNVVRSWPSVVPVNDIIDLRQWVTKAIDDATGMRGAAGPVAQRLGEVKAALDSALENVVNNHAEYERQAVASGRMSPDQTIAGRLQRAADEARNEPGTGGGGGAGYPVGAGGGALGVRGTAGGAGSGAGRVGYGGGAGGVAPGAAVRGRQPESLVDFLISRGGVQDPRGDLTSMGLDTVHHQQGGRLVNPRGMPLDRAMEAAREEGFFPPESSSSPNRQGINDLIDALGEHAAGNPTYRASDMTEAAARRAEQAGTATAEADAHYAATDRVNVVADAAGVRLSAAEREHAAQMVMRGTHPDAAVREAVRSSEEATLHRNAQLSTIGEPGTPAGARQADMPLGGSQRPALRPFSSDELRAYQDWRKQYATFKQTFDQGAPADILQRGEYPSAATAEGARSESRLRGGFSAQDAEVMGKIWNAKTTEAANLRAAQTAGVSPDSLKSWAADDLRSRAVDPATGNFDLKEYAKWRRDHAAGLHVFPDVAASFDSAARAQATLAARQADAAAVAAGHPLAGVKSLSEIPGRYLVSGDGSAEAVRQFVRDTGGNPDALKAFDDYMIYRMRQAGGVENGVINQRGLDRFQKQFAGALSERPEVAAKLATLGRAQNALDDVVARHTAQIEAFQNGVAKNFLNDDPQTAVRKAFASGNPQQAFRQLVTAVRGNADATEGLKRAVVDYIDAMTTSARPATENVDFRKAAVFRNFMRNNRDALKEIFGGQGLQALDQGASELRRAAYSSQAASGSPTTQYLIGAKRAGLHGQEPSGFSNLFAAFVGENGAEVMGAGGVGGLLLGGASVAGKMLGSSLHQAGIRTQNDLIAHAMLNIPVMRQITAMANGNTGHQAMRRLGAAIQATIPGQVAAQEHHQ
jgi:hypothetical protein